MQIQHTGLGFEFFDVSATSTGGNTFYTVSNRVQPPTIDNSTIVYTSIAIALTTSIAYVYYQYTSKKKKSTNNTNKKKKTTKLYAHK
jgi:hypothetical protein